MKSATKRIEEKINAMTAAKDFSFQVNGVFYGETCDECGALHGYPNGSGGKVILSIVGLRLLCYPHGVAHLARIQGKKSVRKPKDVLSAFGLRQEVLV